MLEQLDYGPEQVGWILTLVGAIALIGRGLLTGVVTRHWGEPAVIQASLLIGSAGFVLLLLASTFAAVLVTTGIFTCSITFLRPSIHSLTSKRTTVGQGASMGLSNSFVSLGRVLGMIYAGIVFDINPILPYISGALILFAVLYLESVLGEIKYRRRSLRVYGRLRPSNGSMRTFGEGAGPGSMANAEAHASSACSTLAITAQLVSPDGSAGVSLPTI